MLPRLISLADDLDAIDSLVFSGETTEELVGIHGFLSVLHVVSGEVRLDWGSRALCVTANDLVFFDPGLVRTRQSSRGLAYGIALPIGAGRDVLPSRASVVCTRLDESNARALRSRIAALRDANAPFRFAARRDALVTLLLSIRASLAGEAFTLPGRERAFRLLQTIHERYREPIGPRDVARVHAFRPAYATDMLRRQTGRPIGAWLTAFRLNEARLRLDQGATVTSAARAAGYSDNRYFSRLFARAYGYAPSRHGESRVEENAIEPMVAFSEHHRDRGRTM